MGILAVGLIVALLLVFGVSRAMHRQLRQPPLAISMNTVVPMRFQSYPGSVSVGQGCLMVFHPLLVKNYHPLSEVRTLAVTHWWDCRMVITWNDGTRTALTTPWAPELGTLIQGQLSLSKDSLVSS